MHDARYPEVPPDFGHWLAGFIDGEGCFDMAPREGRVSPRFTLVLRDDDLPILDQIVRLTDIGKVRRQRGRLSTRPMAVWEVRSQLACLRLIALLDAHPLRAKKSRDYAIWREAVLLWVRMPDPRRVGRRGRGSSRLDWSAIAELHRRLRDERAYEPLPPQPEPERPPTLWED